MTFKETLYKDTLVYKGPATLKTFLYVTPKGYSLHVNDITLHDRLVPAEDTSLEIIEIGYLNGTFFAVLSDYSVVYTDDEYLISKITKAYETYDPNGFTLSTTLVDGELQVTTEPLNGEFFDGLEDLRLELAKDTISLKDEFGINDTFIKHGLLYLKLKEKGYDVTLKYGYVYNPHYYAEIPEEFNLFNAHTTSYIELIDNNQVYYINLHESEEHFALPRRFTKVLYGYTPGISYAIYDESRDVHLHVKTVGDLLQPILGNTKFLTVYNANNLADKIDYTDFFPHKK